MTSDRHRGVLNLDCLLNTLFRLKSREPPKPVTIVFYSQSFSNVENDISHDVMDKRYSTSLVHCVSMMTSSNGSIFRVTGHLCGDIHRSPVNSPHQGQWREALMLSLICAWINGWANNREAGDLRCHRAHFDVIVTSQAICTKSVCCRVLLWLGRGSVTKWLFVVVIFIDIMVYTLISYHLHDMLNLSVTQNNNSD